MLNELISQFENISVDNISFYLIGRNLKEGVPKKAKASEKYEYPIYKADVDETLKQELFNTTKNQLLHLKTHGFELDEYDPITENRKDLLFKYDTSIKPLTFAYLITQQLNRIDSIKSFHGIKALAEDKIELWAYMLGIEYIDDTGKEQCLYTFRKLTPTQVVFDKKDNFWNSIFDPESSEFKIIEKETIQLGKSIDCIFHDSIFYVLKKHTFEQLTSIEDDFIKIATDTITDMKSLSGLKGLEILEELAKEKTSYRQKMVQLAKNPSYKTFNRSQVKAALKWAKKYGETLHIDDESNIVISNKDDVDAILRMFIDYYKKGEWSGNIFGSYNGKVIQPK